MAEIKFRCIRCGCEKLEEVMINVTQTSVITAIDDSGAVDYEPDTVVTTDGEVNHYQCAECGETVKDFRKVDVNDPEWLVEVLQGKGAEENPIKNRWK